MKRLIIMILIVSLPIIIFAQFNDISGYKNMYSKLNEDQLNYQLKRVNNDVFVSSMVTAGGVALTGVSALSVVAGVAMVTAEPFISLGSGDEDDNSWVMFWPIILSVYVIQYGGGLALIGGGATMGVTGVGLIMTSSGSIAYELKKKHHIQLELKKFQPVSQDYKPGVGIGLSIALN